MLAPEAVHPCLGRGIALQEADGGLAEGPLEMGVADFVVPSLGTLPSGLM